MDRLERRIQGHDHRCPERQRLQLVDQVRDSNGRDTGRLRPWPGSSTPTRRAANAAATRHPCEARRGWPGSAPATAGVARHRKRPQAEPSDWSLWHASTTASKRSPTRACESIVDALQRGDGLRSTGQASRTSCSVVTMRRTYSRPPPVHRPPLRPVPELEQPVVVAKANERGQREVQDLVTRRRPDRSRHRQQVPVTEGRSISPSRKKRAERDRPEAVSTRAARGFAIEAQRCRQACASTRGATHCAGCAKSVARLVPAHSSAGAVVTHRERHLGGHACARRARANSCEQVRIGAVVEHEEPGVDRVGETVERHVDGVGVTAGPRVGFEHGDRVALLVQEPSASPGRLFRNRRSRCVSSISPCRVTSEVRANSIARRETGALD